MGQCVRIDVIVSFERDSILPILNCPPLRGFLGDAFSGSCAAMLLGDLNTAGLGPDLEYELGGDMHWMTIREGRVRFEHNYIMADGSGYQEGAEPESCDISLDDLLALAYARTEALNGHPSQIKLTVDYRGVQCG